MAKWKDWIGIAVAFVLVITWVSHEHDNGYDKGYKAAQKEFCNENNPYAGYDEGYKYGLDDGYAEGYGDGYLDCGGDTYKEWYRTGYYFGYADGKKGREYDETPR